MRKIYHINTSQKKAEVAILTSDRAYFKARTVIRHKEGHYIKITRSLLQEDITNDKVYIPNNRR